MNNKDILILSFALGGDIALRGVLGLPPMLSMRDTLNLSLGKIICSELNFTFQLLLDYPGKEMPDEVFLPDSNLCVLPGVPSNLTSLVHYTIMDDFVNPNCNQAISSDDIIV